MHANMRSWLVGGIILDIGTSPCASMAFFLAKKKNLGFVVFVCSCLQRCRRHIQCATEDEARLIGGMMGGCQVSGPA